MAKTYTGIDIGANQIKMTVCSGGTTKRGVCVPVPENLVKDGQILSYEVMAAHIKSAGRKNGINVKDAAISFPPKQAFVRRLTLPRMTVDQLALNLPYEFRDYISQDKDQYFYDYYVISELLGAQDEKSLDIMAAATAKESVSKYAAMLKKGGFHLRTIIPEELAYGNLIREYEKANPSKEERDYCIIDLGHEGTRVHLYNGSTFEVTRRIEIGGRDLDLAIAQAKEVNLSVAQSYKHSNFENVLLLPQCSAIYSNIAVEIMRAINFYGFNYPESTLDKAYLCGGGSKVGPLIRQIRENISLELDGISLLMPKAAKSVADPFLYPIACGVTMQ